MEEPPTRRLPTAGEPRDPRRPDDEAVYRRRRLVAGGAAAIVLLLLIVLIASAGGDGEDTKTSPDDLGVPTTPSNIGERRPDDRDETETETTPRAPAVRARGAGGRHAGRSRWRNPGWHGRSGRDAWCGHGGSGAGPAAATPGQPGRRRRGPALTRRATAFLLDDDYQSPSRGR